MKASDRYFVKDVTCSLNGNAMPVANLSVGGLFAGTDQPPMMGQVVELELTLLGHPPFRLFAQVTWINDPVKPKAPDLPLGFGVKITRIAFPDKLAILNLLKRARLPNPRRPP
jgi:Tfp pilus assembly protein PilZ